MKYSELDRLQIELVQRADRDRRNDQELLKAATLGARALGDAVVAQLVAKIASRLYHQPANHLERALCRGALLATLDSAVSTREMLPFALQLVHRASYASPSPLSVRLPDTTAATALEYLDKYTASPARVEAMTKAVTEFVTKNQEMAAGLFFARFIADLEFLQHVIADEKRPTNERRTAGGALTYFIEKHDAIDDELGIVGLLDDAYVAQLAAEKLDPPRRVKTALVDGILGQWPFLASLRLTLPGGEWSPSEFMLLNLAVGYGKDASARNAIILPTAGDLSIWLGVLAAVGALHDSVDHDAVPLRPAIGEHVAVTGDDQRVFEIVGYADSAGCEWRPSTPDALPPADLRYVWLKYLPRGRRPGGQAVKERKSVDFLATCVPASTRVNRRRTTLPTSRSDIPIGPLEHLFGLDHPPRFIDLRQRFVLVAPLGHAKELLTRTLFMGTSLSDIISCGRADPEREYEIEWWSPRNAVRGLRQLGVDPTEDFPVLTVARDLAEAAAIARRRSKKDLSILASIEQAEAAASLITDFDDCRVLALVPQHATEAQTDVRRRSFHFLDWTPELERAVAHHPRSAATEIDDYESAVRSRLHNRLNVHDVDLDSVECSLASLKELGRAFLDEYGDEPPGTLVVWADGAQRLFFDLDSVPLPVTGESLARVTATLDELKSGLRTQSRLWSEVCASRAKSYAAELERLTQDLGRDNPKAAALQELLTKPTAVRCSTRHWDDLHRHFPRTVRLVDGRGAEAAADMPVVLFEWAGRKRMARLVVPPIGDPTDVVFYGWARQGLQRLRRARQQQVEDNWGPHSRPPAWQLNDVPRCISDGARSENDQPAAFAVEAWIQSLRRQNAIAQATSMGSGDDPVMEARAVYFVGGAYALYTADYEVAVATNLSGPSAGAERALHYTEAFRLRVGDVVVVVSGSDSDAIRERADAKLPNGLRDLARTWHSALMRLRTSVRSDRELARVLHAAGSDKKEATFVGWLRSRTQIGPHNESDVDAIAKASNDPTLVSKLDSCKAAIHRVRGEHHRASHELFTMAVEQVRQRLAKGEAVESSIALDDRVRGYVVETIDDKTAMVASSVTNVVTEPE